MYGITRLIYLKTVVPLLVIHLICITINGGYAQQYTRYVNPFIGTSNYGATNPGAVMPHGMVSVTPFNVAFKKGTENKFEKDSEWHSRPYVFGNKFLTGFSHVNLSGVGCPDLGSIITMPTTGALELDPEQYGSGYEKEQAQPGYYSNELSDYGIKVEVTSTNRTGLSRYTFPEGKSNVILNLGLALTNETGASLKFIDKTKFEGFKTIGTFCYNPEDVRPVYFVGEVSKTPSSFGTWKQMPKYKGVESEWIGYNDEPKPYKESLFPVAGDNIGGYFEFNTEEGEQIEIKVAVSYVSIENAWENLRTEQPAFNFEEIQKRSENAWEELLSRIKITSNDEEAKTIFYSALYHTLLHPNVINDVNGDFPVMGGHDAGNSDRNRYTVFSLWDTYRNVHPFLSLVYPELQSQMVQTMVDMYKESGWLPKWELLGMETEVMVGDPATPVIADTYLRGIKDFDVETAYEAIKKASKTKESENLLRPGIDQYNTYGFVPEDSLDIWGGSVSSSLEYYISDWNIAQLAKHLGYNDDYKLFLKKSLGYKNLFDVTTGMLRPKFEDGSWLTPFNPEAGKNFEPVIGYVEGNAWQYRFYVPHDIKGLTRLLGGKQQFSEQLQLLFDSDNYDMANEPDITSPYLFNYVAGEEWRSQKKVRELIDLYYKNAPDGIPGNDDTGTLSTWLIFSMLGIYPVCPGDMNYAVVTPYFDEVEIELNSSYYKGESLIINTKGERAKGTIRSYGFNGKKQNSYFIHHDMLTSGGRLEFIIE